MAKLQFLMLDLKYKIIDSRAQICIFGKTDKGKVMLFDPTYKPYFYVITKSIDAVLEKLKSVKVENRDVTAKVTSTKIVKKKLLGCEVEAIQVFVNLPRALRMIAREIRDWDIIESVHEYDITFTRKYLIDKEFEPLTMFEAEVSEELGGYKIDSYSIKDIKPIEGKDELDIMAFDIETYFTHGMPNPDSDPIIMLSLYGKNYHKVITYKKFETEHDYIEFVDGEDALIERFKEILRERKPDILTAYNSDYFDFPYIRERAKKYKIKLDIGLDGMGVRFGRGTNQSAEINGIVHIDIYQFIRRFMKDTLKTDSLKLDNVAQEILGERKIDVDLSLMKDAWDNNEGLEIFAEYNLHDSKLTYELCKQFIPNILEFTKLTNIPAFDLIRMGFSQIVEGFLLKQAKIHKLIAPNRPTGDQIQTRRRETYPGGFVYQPTPGMYKDIAVFDFRSLYPTIISAHNIGLGTMNCDCCKDEPDIAPTEHGKFWFCKKRKGFISTIIEDIVMRRMRIKEIIKKKGKEKMLDARQYSLKIMANSFYGYLAFFGARWYSIECARSITAYARFYIKRTIKEAEGAGFNVIYSDTDSVFLTLDGKTRDDAEKFKRMVNKKLPGIMELELEGFFPSGIFVSAKMGAQGAKKKYALISEEGDMKITGFETVRSNWSDIAKDVQQEVLGIILKEQNPEKALKYVQTMLGKLADGKVTKDKVVMHTKLMKELSDYENIGPHVAIARKMEAKGLAVNPGTIIEYIVCKGKGVIRDRVKMPEECKEGDYDPDYYKNNQVIPAIDKIFEVLGYEKSLLTDSRGQKGLQEFFG